LKLTKNRRLLIALGLATALLLAMFSPFASKSPDGLQRVAEDNGFAHAEKESPFKVIAGSAFSWVGNDEAANALAGVTGVLLVAAVTSGFALGLQRLGRKPQPPAGGPRLDNDT
jgi:hypothetical protein